MLSIVVRGGERGIVHRRTTFPRTVVAVAGGGGGGGRATVVVDRVRVRVGGGGCIVGSNGRGRGDDGTNDAANASVGVSRQRRRTFLTRASRGEGMRAFFDMLERRYGNLNDLFDDGPSGETIVSSSSSSSSSHRTDDGDCDDVGDDGVLRADDLVRLFRHEATALHVPNFYHADDASRLGDELIRESLSSSSSSTMLSPEGVHRLRHRPGVGGGRGGGGGGGGEGPLRIRRRRRPTEPMQLK
jgi:hypothetical protein